MTKQETWVCLGLGTNHGVHGISPKKRLGITIENMGRPYDSHHLPDETTSEAVRSHGGYARSSRSELDPACHIPQRFPVKIPHGKPPGKMEWDVLKTAEESD
jgi:hypothetical protein